MVKVVPGKAPELVLALLKDSGDLISAGGKELTLAAIGAKIGAGGGEGVVPYPPLALPAPPAALAAPASGGKKKAPSAPSVAPPPAALAAHLDPSLGESSALPQPLPSALTLLRAPSIAALVKHFQRAFITNNIFIAQLKGAAPLDLAREADSQRQARLSGRISAGLPSGEGGSPSLHHQAVQANGDTLKSAVPLFTMLPFKA